jgi:hypothetical protein
VIGKELYLDEGGTAKRKLFSLIRLARDPQMSMAYLVSQQMEEAGLSPKVPYIGYTGQFQTDADAWHSLNRVPRAFVQVDGITEGTGGTLLPIPQRQAFAPNFQAYEVAKDSCRRAVQAALGINPLPTAAQRTNEKSGVALERIEAQQDLGSFHFLDNLERAIAYAGRVIESWIPVVYDTQREIALRKADDSHRIITLNTPAPYTDPRTQETQHYPITDDVDHYVTTGSGPSYASQREEAADFLNTLIKSMPNLPVPPAAQAKLLSLGIQMRQLGPKGDEMAELISPDPQGNMSPQAMAQIQQAQAQLQQTQLVIQELQGELQKLQLERQAKVIDNQYRIAPISATWPQWAPRPTSSPRLLTRSMRPAWRPLAPRPTSKPSRPTRRTRLAWRNCIRRSRGPHSSSAAAAPASTLTPRTARCIRGCSVPSTTSDSRSS